jgi:membrane protein implicated in regulation of membrane protease activity
MKAEFLLWLGVAMILAGLAVGIVRHEWPILAFLARGTMALSLSVCRRVSFRSRPIAAQRSAGPGNQEARKGCHGRSISRGMC